MLNIVWLWASQVDFAPCKMAEDSLFKIHLDRYKYNAANCNSYL